MLSGSVRGVGDLGEWPVLHLVSGGDVRVRLDGFGDAVTVGDIVSAGQGHEGAVS